MECGNNESKQKGKRRSDRDAKGQNKDKKEDTTKAASIRKN